jgi:hypothetical protein
MAFVKVKDEMWCGVFALKNASYGFVPINEGEFFSIYEGEFIPIGSGKCSLIIGSKFVPH